MVTSRALATVIDENGFIELPVLVRHTVAPSTLPALHRAPVDRLLIAQAQSEQLTLVTRDPLVRQYRTKMLRA